MSLEVTDIRRKTIGPCRASQNLAVGDLVRLNSANYWTKARAEDTGSAIAQGVVTAPASKGGLPEVSYEAQVGGYSGLIPGAPVYLSAVAGTITQSFSYFAQQLGRAISDSVVEFNINPSSVIANRAGFVIGNQRYIGPQAMPYTIPAKALVALRKDDGTNDEYFTDGTAKPAAWGTGNWNFGSCALNGAACSPKEYADFYGIPVGQAVRGDYIENPNAVAGKLLSHYQIADRQKHGCDVSAHTYSHGSVGTPLEFTTENMYRETVGVRDQIDALENCWFEIDNAAGYAKDATTIHIDGVIRALTAGEKLSIAGVEYTIASVGSRNLPSDQDVTLTTGLAAAVANNDPVCLVGWQGLTCKGYVESGNITATQQANKWPSIEMTHNQLIRSGFEWSEGWMTLGTHPLVGGDMMQHHPSVIHAATITSANVDLHVAAMSQPGCRTVIYYHSAEEVGCGFKTLIDKLVAARANGLVPVTLRAMHSAYLPVPGFTPTLPLTPVGDNEARATVPVVFAEGTADTTATILVADTTGLQAGMSVNLSVKASGATSETRIIDSVLPNTSITLTQATTMTGVVTIAAGLPTTSTRDVTGFRVQQNTFNAAVGVDASGGNPNKCIRAVTQRIGTTGNYGYAAFSQSYNVIPDSVYAFVFDQKLASGAQPVVRVSYFEMTGTDSATERYGVYLDARAFAADWETKWQTIGIPSWCSVIRITWEIGQYQAADYRLDNTKLFRIG